MTEDGPRCRSSITYRMILSAVSICPYYFQRINFRELHRERIFELEDCDWWNFGKYGHLDVQGTVRWDRHSLSVARHDSRKATIWCKTQAISGKYPPSRLTTAHDSALSTAQQRAALMSCQRNREKWEKSVLNSWAGLSHGFFVLFWY